MSERPGVARPRIPDSARVPDGTGHPAARFPMLDTLFNSRSRPLCTGASRRDFLRVGGLGGLGLGHPGRKQRERIAGFGEISRCALLFRSVVHHSHILPASTGLAFFYAIPTRHGHLRFAHSDSNRIYCFSIN